MTPRAISRGKSDDYPLRLRQSINVSGEVVYLRPFGEMNLHFNPYSAFNADGSPRLATRPTLSSSPGSGWS